VTLTDESSALVCCSSLAICAATPATKVDATSPPKARELEDANPMMESAIGIALAFAGTNS